MITSQRGSAALCSFAVALAVTLVPSTTSAQSTGARQGPHGSHGSKAAEGADPTHAIHEAMSGDMSANPHIRMSPRRVATPADSARADRLAAQARRALVRYKDVRIAQREGYHMFAPNVKNQPVYHFTQTGAAIRAQFKLDITRPTSLLYKQTGDGAFALVGAMYTAPKDASWDDLDARVPLGIARWHLHTNMCVPRLRETERWIEIKDGKPVFGPLSPIATRDACDAVDGRFLPVVFNWMVHINMFESDAWADHH